MYRRAQARQHPQANCPLVLRMDSPIIHTTAHRLCLALNPYSLAVRTHQTNRGLKEGRAPVSAYKPQKQTELTISQQLIDNNIYR
jgi:hypothetical protein